MRKYKYSADYDDPLIAELYDRHETSTDDLDLIRKLIDDSRPLNVLELFAGTGRILVPLLADGHALSGIDIAHAVIERARIKARKLGNEALDRLTLAVQDAVKGRWGIGYDLVILGANAFYELPSAKLQERCIRYAYDALARGGHLFVDNDDYKGDWADGPFGRVSVVFEGTGFDGTFGRFCREAVKFDADESVLHMKRSWLTRDSRGSERLIEYLAKKRPVCAAEVKGWLAKYGFKIRDVFGDRAGTAYTDDSGRAIFWAQKPQW